MPKFPSEEDSRPAYPFLRRLQRPSSAVSPFSFPSSSNYLPSPAYNPLSFTWVKPIPLISCVHSSMIELLSRVTRPLKNLVPILVGFPQNCPGDSRGKQNEVVSELKCLASERVIEFHSNSLTNTMFSAATCHQ
jgi:hypothetical protein